MANIEFLPSLQVTIILSSLETIFLIFSSRKLLFSQIDPGKCPFEIHGYYQRKLNKYLGVVFHLF